MTDYLTVAEVHCYTFLIVNRGVSRRMPMTLPWLRSHLTEDCQPSV